MYLFEIYWSSENFWDAKSRSINRINYIKSMLQRFVDGKIRYKEIWWKLSEKNLSILQTIKLVRFARRIHLEAQSTLKSFFARLHLITVYKLSFIPCACLMVTRNENLSFMIFLPAACYRKPAGNGASFSFTQGFWLGHRK